MDKISLTPTSALNGASARYEGFSITEVTDLTLVSVAAHASTLNNTANALQSSFNLAWPSVGQSTSNGSWRCLGVQAEQVFLFSQSADDHYASVAEQLASHASITDQSDSWVCLQLSGEHTRRVLERLCLLDLDTNIFIDGAVARTVMEHLTVVVYRQGDDFILLSARSSASSFYHALITSADSQTPF